MAFLFECSCCVNITISSPAGFMFQVFIHNFVPIFESRKELARCITYSGYSLVVNSPANELQTHHCLASLKPTACLLLNSKQVIGCIRLSHCPILCKCTTLCSKSAPLSHSASLLYAPDSVLLLQHAANIMMWSSWLPIVHEELCRWHSGCMS